MSEGNTEVTDTIANESLKLLTSFLGVSADELGTVMADHVITEHILARAREFNDLQCNNMKLYASIDEMKALCSKKVETLKSKVDSLTRDEDSVNETQIRLQEQVAQLTADRQSAIDKLDSVQCELKDVQNQKDGLLANKQDIVKLLDEKVGELDASKKETNELLRENKDLRQKLLDVENEIQNNKCKELSDRSEMEVVKQQVALLTKSNEWLEKDITSKTEQFIKYRRENDVELQRSLKELASIKGEFQIEKSSREFLTTKNHELSQQIQAKLLEVKSLNDSLNTERQEFSREMSLKQKLIDLLEEQVDSLNKEIRLAADSKASSIDIEDEMSLKKTGHEGELDQLQLKLEASEQERLRLDALVRDLLGEADDEKDTSSTPPNVSLSKLYGDLSVLKKQLIKERHQKESLQRQVESFIVELEYKVPFINSLKDRTSALEKELNDAALLLEHTSNEKEKTSRELEATSSKVKQYESNINTLVRQRSDLAHQVQFLLVNISVHSDSRGPLTDEETAFIRRLLANEDPSIDSDSQRVITERLVEFKDIATLQQRNAELLKTVRNLASKLEDEERKTNKNIDSLENETISEAKEAIVILQDYNAKLESQMEIITKERDAYKTIISERENAKNGITSAQSHKDKERDALIKDLEARLSNLSAEASKNIQMLNEEIQALHKARTEVTISLEKERSSRTLTEERLKLLQGTLEMAKRENSELSKRSHNLQENMSNQEMKTTETVNKYIACKSKLSVLESKASYLEAEKSILIGSNDSMKTTLQKVMEEKNTLTVAIAQLQTIQSERENLLKDTQTSYKEKVDRLGETLTKLTSTLNAKEEEIKALEQSRNSQVNWYQEKLDTVGDEQKQLRVEVIEKEASLRQLKSQIDNLTKRLSESESKVLLKSSLNDVESDESTELKVRHNLEKVTLQLNDAFSQVEQYRELSSAAEEACQQLRADYDRAKEEFDSEITKLTTEKAQQQNEVSSLKEKIDFLNNEYASQRNKSEEEKHELSKKLSSLEDNKNALDNLKMEFQIKMDRLKSDLEQQTAYANTAQSNYEQELQRHAEVARTIHQLRAEVQSERTEITKLKASEKEAREVLDLNEKTWFDQRAEYERDLESHKDRFADLSNQNKLLFDQIELLSHKKDTLDEESSSDSRELLSSLRRERDILETKLTVSKREEKLLRQRQLTLEDELSEVRAKFLKSKSDDYDQAALAKQHTEIMEQLNQMNLLRESNITLRNAAETAQERNADLQRELADLQNKFLPLENEVENCRQSIKERDQEINVLREETERWKARSHDILRRQEKIDPEEFKKLEEQVSSLQEQLTERVKENTDLNDRFNRLKKQAHEKLNASKIAQANVSAELTDLTAAKIKLEEMLKEEQVKVSDLNKLLSEKSSDSGSIEELRKELDSSVEKAKDLESTLQQTVLNSEKQASELNGEITSLTEKINTLKEKKKEIQQVDQSENDISTVVESMKRAFEEEKISFVRELQQGFAEKLQEEKAKLNSQSAASEPTQDLDELKRKWEATQEEAISQRIKEAEDNLKKRIRKPTEERINKVLEKRKAELEEEYQRKLNQSSVQPNQDNETQLEALRKELEKEFETKYEELLGTVKKKAFEEGKQQAAMKSTLLERKISKLEAQLNKVSEPKAESGTPATNNNIPSKIDERNGVNVGTATIPTSSEKVLKLGEKPSFQVQTASASNPFTSGPFSSNNMSQMKPAFTIPANPKVEPDSSFASSNQSDSVTPQLQKEEEIENDDIPEAQTTTNLQPSTGEVSPLKRPADSVPSDGASPKREKQESSAADQSVAQ